MAGRNRGTSPYHDDDYEDDYSDDFDDSATETGGKRYKTRSPILRSGEIRRNHSRTTGTSLKENVEPSEKSEPLEPETSEKGSKIFSKRDSKTFSEKGSKTFRNPEKVPQPDDSLVLSATPHSQVTHDDYEDDFVTPRSRVTYDDRTLNPKRGRDSVRRAMSEYMSSSFSSRKHRSNRGRGGRGRGGRISGRMSTETKPDNITKRVLSARRLRINELTNANQESAAVIKDLKEEIKLLKKTQVRQDKALQRFEDRESDLPQLIQRQNNEVRTLRDQIRKWREKYEKSDRYLRDAEDELEKVKMKLKKLKNLADEKDLPERAELNKKLNNQELEIEAKDVKIRELERYIQNLEKNHRHELGIERARQKDMRKQFEQIKEENQKLSTTVEEKQKEIQMKNIYAGRATRPPHRLPNSYSGTPQGTPPPRKRRPSLSGADGITPRERAKQMEEKRREDMRKQRELKQKQKRNRQKSAGYGSDYSSLSHATYDRPPHPPAGGSPHRPIIRTKPDFGRYTHVEQQEKMRREEELRKRREQEDRDREQWERQEQERRLQETERALNEQAKRDEDDRRLRDERERLKRQSDERARQERERKEREERERREEKERREREERERKEKREREERERRERERLEQERRAQEEMRRFEDDVSIQAERKKKDEILQKLREIDEGVAKQRDKVKSNDPFFVTEGKESSQDSMASSKKSYTFTKPVENLHKGKPSHKEDLFGSPSKSTKASHGEVMFGSPAKTTKPSHNDGLFDSPTKTTNRRRGKDTDIDDLDTGGYNPTFGGKKGGLSLFDDDEPKPTKSKPAAKSKLMADLFGSSDPPARQDDIFGSSQAKKSDTSNTRPSFLFDDDDASKSRKNVGTKRENSATLFGGGSALIHDEDFQKSQQRSNVMRRPKQTTTFHNKPTVNAIDPLDDDIEEVML